MILVIEYGQHQGVFDEKIEKHRGGKMDYKIDQVVTEHLILSSIPVQGKGQIGQWTLNPFSGKRVLRLQEEGLFQGRKVDLLHMNVVIAQDIRFVVVYPNTRKARCVNQKKHDEKIKERRNRLLGWLTNSQGKGVSRRSDCSIWSVEGRRKVWVHIQALHLSSLKLMGIDHSVMLGLFNTLKIRQTQFVKIRWHPWPEMR